jgi:hypothetical protein
MTTTTIPTISDMSREATVTGLDRPNRQRDRRVRTALATLVALAAGCAALMALSVAPAGAALQFSASVGEISGPAVGMSFSALRSESVAVNDLNGHILVADSGTGNVYDFNSAADTSPTTWNGSTTPAGSFGGAGVAVAVDNATGDVYVADSTHAVIDKFNAAGALVTTFGDASPAANGQLAGNVTPAGAFVPAGSFGIAVDQSTHHLYVLDAGHQVVDVFDATGAYLSQINDPAAAAVGLYGCGGGYADGIAVNATSGHVFVSDSCSVKSFEFDPSGSFVTAWDGTGTPAGSFGGGYTSVAVDNSSGDFYVNDTSNSVVDAFDAAGTYLGQITGTPTGTAGGVAVGQSSGSIYVADGGTGSVKVFGPGAIIPDAAAKPATAVSQTSGTLNGHLDPAGAGAVTACHFDYADDATYQGSGFSSAQTTPCTEGNAFANPADVHADISGLSPETTYHFRLSVTNANGTNTASALTFTTLSAVVLSTGAASDITQTSATVNGTLNPGGIALASCQFEYGPSSSYGASLPCSQSLASIGSGISDTSVSARLDGLHAGSIYHYRIKASNALGTTNGPDQTLVTQSAGFGFQSFAFKLLDQAGQPYRQAGGHPYALQANMTFNTKLDRDGNVVPDGMVKDVTVSLPAGLVGDQTAVPTCTYSDLIDDNCSSAAQIGVIQADASGTLNPFPPEGVPIYNMERPDNLPAQFGFNVSPVTATIDTRVRTGSDYGLESEVNNISAAIPLLATRLTIWGNPADPSHNGLRDCPGRRIHLGCATAQPPSPLLTLPTNCGDPLTVTARADSWQDRDNFVTATDTLPATTGCDKLQFNPSLSLRPDTSAADSSAGLDVDLKVPQDGLKDVNGLGAANLKKAVVTLPAGFSLNPAAADGLNACSAAQIGLGNSNEPSCPDASKVGTAEIHSPLIPDPVEGSLYLARQDDNPFHTLLSGYLVARGDGVLIKLPGRFDERLARRAEEERVWVADARRQAVALVGE